MESRVAICFAPITPRGGSVGARRSEEHTSELQSRLHLVCRLLLEKKKNRCYNMITSLMLDISDRLIPIIVIHHIQAGSLSNTLCQSCLKQGLLLRPFLRVTSHHLM